MGIVEFRALGGESEQQLAGGDGTLADSVPVNRCAAAESTAHRFRHVEHSGKSKTAECSFFNRNSCHADEAVPDYDLTGRNIPIGQEINRFAALDVARLHRLLRNNRFEFNSRIDIHESGRTEPAELDPDIDRIDLDQIQGDLQTLLRQILIIDPFGDGIVNPPSMK